MNKEFEKDLEKLEEMYNKYYITLNEYYKIKSKIVDNYLK